MRRSFVCSLILTLCTLSTEESVCSDHGPTTLVN